MTCQRLDVSLSPVFSLKPCSLCLSFSVFISLLCLSLFIPSINHLSIIVPCKLNTHLGDCTRESASWFGFCYTHKKKGVSPAEDWQPVQGSTQPPALS